MGASNNTMKVEPQQLAIGGIASIVAIALVAVVLSLVLAPRDIVGFATSICTPRTFTGGGCTASGNYYLCTSMQYCNNEGSGFVSCTGNVCGTPAQTCNNNGVKDAGEQCDGSDFGTYGTGVVQCSVYNSKFISGTISCSTTCTIIQSACSTTTTTLCGNGIPETGEQCDDGILDKKPNPPHGACVIDKESTPAVMCKNNVCQDGYLNSPTEQCDDGNNVISDGCSPGCTLETTNPTLTVIATTVTVSSSPVGITNCGAPTGADCTEAFPSGTRVTLTLPETGTISWYLTGVTLVSGCTTGNTCVFTTGSSPGTVRVSSIPFTPTGTSLSASHTDPVKTLRAAFPTNGLDTNKWLVLSSDSPPATSGTFAARFSGITAETSDAASFGDADINLRYDVYVASVFKDSTVTGTFGIPGVHSLYVNGVQDTTPSVFDLAAGWNTLIVVVDTEPTSGTFTSWSFTGGLLGSRVPLLTHYYFDYNNDGKLADIVNPSSDGAAYIDAGGSQENWEILRCIINRPLQFYMYKQGPNGASGTEHCALIAEVTADSNPNP